MPEHTWNSWTNSVWRRWIHLERQVQFPTVILHLPHHDTHPPVSVFQSARQSSKLWPDYPKPKDRFESGRRRKPLFSINYSQIYLASRPRLRRSTRYGRTLATVPVADCARAAPRSLILTAIEMLA